MNVNAKSCAVLPGASTTDHVPLPAMSWYLPDPPIHSIVPDSGTLVGHENLVAVAVGLNARAGEGVALAPRLRVLDAADREIIERLRPVERPYDAGAFGGGI